MDIFGLKQVCWRANQEKPLSYRSKVSVPQTDTGRQVENTKAYEITLAKELGKMVP